ncbi:uncharacterized protein LOC124664394 [Lolium rigidum]|uniref:uncharacterized protein LOC124664394 n=1 Tax=Lolium rigidum TaxID=89674 RepID=UPI001F5DB735|nr:uncharacterized protein LOC124664394 [Lolium rigidum]
MHMAHDPNEDRTFAAVDNYINEYGMDDDIFVPPGGEEPSPAAAAGKPNCNKRLFSSQETPPAVAFTETQETTNLKCDGPPVPKNIAWRVHVAGERMLVKRLYDAAPGPMRSLVDGVQHMEERRLREKDNGYSVYVAKVPSGQGFVDSPVGQKIFLWYDDIFSLVNTYPLHYTFVRLYSLSMAMRIIRNTTPGIAIADPLYMRAIHLSSIGDRKVASEYLKGFFLANQKKDNILLPYFLEDNICTLISICPRHSTATYFDADSKSSTDYTHIKSVLDDALNGYVKAKGLIETRIARYGKHVFKHVTNFP